MSGDEIVARMRDQLGSFIERGWKIFPVFAIESDHCKCGDRECKDAGKHPMVRSWPKEATSDASKILWWFARMQGCNWAVATGHRSRVVALDLDPRKDGVENFRRWIENRGESVPSTLVHATGGAGWHYLFKPTGALKSRNDNLPGVDVKGDGGYVLLPGSNHASGGRYSVAKDLPLAPVPDWLEALVQVSRIGNGSTGAHGDGFDSDLTPTDELRAEGFRLGQRDPGFHALAWRLVRQHWPHLDVIYEVAREVYEQTDQPSDDMYPWPAVEEKIRRASEVLGPEIDAQLAWASELRSIA